MQIMKVNSTLQKGLGVFQMSENAALQEYTGMGGNFGSIDTNPSGDPVRGGDGGVDNNSVDEDAFDSYIEQTMMAVTSRCGVSMDAALDYVVQAADEMADSGKIPAMPDPDSASSEEMSAWAGAAKTAQLGAEAIRLCLAAEGDEQHVGVG